MQFPLNQPDFDPSYIAAAGYEADNNDALVRFVSFKSGSAVPVMAFKREIYY